MRVLSLSLMLTSYHAGRILATTDSTLYIQLTDKLGGNCLVNELNATTSLNQFSLKLGKYFIDIQSISMKGNLPVFSSMEITRLPQRIGLTQDYFEIIY